MLGFSNDTTFQVTGPFILRKFPQSQSKVDTVDCGRLDETLKVHNNEKLCIKFPRIFL